MLKIKTEARGVDMQLGPNAMQQMAMMAWG